MHSNPSLGGKVNNQVRIFRSHGCRRNSCGKAESSVGKAVVRVTYRSNQRRDRAKLGSGFGPGSAIANGLSVSGERKSCLGLLFIENFVEEHDLPRNLVT